MGTYNVSKIEGWLEDFTSAKNKFNNTYYSDYKNSYIRSCSDSAVIRMRNKLNQHYDRIIRINNRIKNVWDDFLYDLKAVDNRLAGGKGSTNDSTVASKLSKLPSLKEYKADLKVRINSASAVVGTVDAIGWSEDKTLEENLQNSLEILGSTAAVTATSVVSGIFGLAEDLVDGVLLLGTQAVTGVATLFGEEEWAESAQNTMMDVISFDAVGEANKAFYENTSVGREINENSLIKYDSEIAQGIQDASTKLAEFAAATALTVATGGVAAPVAILIVGGTGYLIGSGDKAQESFSEEDRDFWEDSKETTIAGGIKAVEFYSEGKMGAGMVQAAGAIQSAGGVTNFLKNMRTALSNGKSSLFTRESLKNGFRATLKDADTYIDSIGAALNNITYDSENGLQVNWEGLVQETACNFASNSVFGFVGNSFETRMTNGMESLGLNAKSPDVNTSGMKNTIDDVNTNKAMFSSTSSKPKTDSNIASLRKEYDELLSKSKESWFVQAKEARDNGWAWNLNEINEVDNMVRRMEELEGSLGVKNTSIPESQIYDYSQAKKEADILAEEIREKPIPGFEKIDTNSQEYKSAIHAMYSNPSPSGKQDLSQIDNLFNKKKSSVDSSDVKIKNKGNTFIGDKVGGSASDSDVLRRIDEIRNAKANNMNNPKKASVSSTSVKDLNKSYVDNILDLKKKGISFEKYASDNGIEIKDFKTELDLAVDIGDANWYLVNVIKNSGDMADNAVRAAINKPRADLNFDELLNVAGPYLKEQDLKNLDIISKNPNMANITQQNINTMFQFQDAGGCEISGICRGKNYGLTLEEIEHAMNGDRSGYNKLVGKNRGHARVIDKNYTIIDEMDDIIKNNANTVTIKGVGYYNSVGPNVPTDHVLDLIDTYGANSPEVFDALDDLIGLDMTDKGFNSRTIPPTRETNYKKRYSDPNGDLEIKVESYISPGCGAYIDTYGGITNGLGEITIKRNCKQTVIDAYEDPTNNKLVLVTLYS